MKRYGYLALVLLLGCGDSDPAEKKDPATKQEKKVFKLDINNINPSNVKEIALVPSPAEMQKALNRAGLQSKLGDLALSEKSISMNTDNKDQLAIRCGVVLAELVLTVKTAPKPKMLAHLESLKKGFTKGRGN